MEKLFGIPMGPLAVALAVVLAVVVGAVLALALRNRVFLKLGVRSVGRRPARTALIVAGLMLGTTIITAALASGDTMSHTIRSASIESLGSTDVVVSAKGATIDALTPLAEAEGVDYFSELAVPQVTHELLRTESFDGVAPAIIEPVAVQDLTSRQSEPRVALFGSAGPNLLAFAPIRTSSGQVLSLDDLAPGQVYLNEDAAEELGAARGDSIVVLTGERRAPARVREIVRFSGAGTHGPAVLTSLTAAQELFDRRGQVKYVLISNVGDERTGAALTDELIRQLEPRLAQLNLDLHPVKSDALEAANAEGNAFMSLFTTFGSFSIVAGILLIFLIFVMLAAERRGELGISRAVGTRRGHLVQMFVYEGLAYALLAAAVGAAAGVLIAFGMVFVLSSALNTEGIAIEPTVQVRSIVVAYSLGVLLTFAVVAASAWRVSRLNIVTAIRNLPDPPATKSRRRWIAGAIGVVLGVALIASGVSSAAATPFFVGVAAVAVGAVPIALRLGVPPRLAYTAVGLGVVVFNLLPWSVYDWITQTKLAMDFSVWIISGLVVVLGAAWVIVYNADILLGVVAWAFSRVRSLTPVLRMSIAYPLRNRFRTGVTLAMFTLVVFTLVVGASISGSFIRVFENSERFAGGFEVRAAAARTIDDPAAALAGARGIGPGAVRAVAAQSYLPVEARQVVAGTTFEKYPVRGVDSTFLDRTTWGFTATARGYPDPWTAMRQEPGLAIVDGFVAPRRDNWSAGMVPPDFQLQGFYVEDEVFDAVPVAVRDVQTGRILRLKVIGVLSDFAPPEHTFGITTSQETLRATFGDRVEPTIYSFDLAPGVDPRATATAIEAHLLRYGLEAEALEENLEESVAASWTMNRLIEGFMGLGLVVGVAALGVISARAVVERRQQIGILRAIGFRRRMIQLSFLIESSFIALTAIAAGTVFALIVAGNIVRDTRESPIYSDLALYVPWGNLAIIFATVYLVALGTTLAPALRASRIYPAEALRYE